MESARRYCSLLEKLSPPSVGGFNAKASAHRGAGSVPPALDEQGTFSTR